MLLRHYFRFIASLFIISSILYIPKSFALTSDDSTKILLNKALSPTPILEDLKELTTVIGGRPSGSPAMNKATNWALTRFSLAGLENVHAEGYTPARNWLPRIERGEITHPYAFAGELRVAAMPFSLSTAKEGLEAEVYNIGSGDEVAFSTAGNEIKGRWLLVTTPLMHTLDDLSEEYSLTGPIFTRAKQSGAAGVLWLASRPGRLLYRHNITFNGSLAPLPAAVIEREGGKHIAHLLKRGQRVKVKLTIQNEIQEKPINHNVIAEIRGWETPDEVVILGAHLDSWDLLGRVLWIMAVMSPWSLMLRDK